MGWMIANLGTVLVALAVLAVVAAVVASLRRGKKQGKSSCGCSCSGCSGCCAATRRLTPFRGGKPPFASPELSVRPFQDGPGRPAPIPRGGQDVPIVPTPGGV